MIYKLLALSAVFILLVFNVSNAQILAKIETYNCAPYPQSEDDEKETYYYRISDGKPVPPTLTDVFICDIWQRIHKDLHLDITASEINEAKVNSAFTVYLTTDWAEIAGYRPWTHWNFIRSLSVEERKVLSTEVVAYVLKNGIKDAAK